MLRDKFLKKKRTFQQTFCSVWNFLELRFLFDDLVDSLELSMFINALLPKIYYLRSGYRAGAWEKNIFLDTIYIVSFYKKALMDDLN